MMQGSELEVAAASVPYLGHSDQCLVHCAGQEH